MRFSIGHKLAAVTVLPALLAASLSILALIEADIERQQFAQIESLSNMSLRTDDLTEAVQEIVIAADAVTIEPDRTAAKTLLDNLNRLVASLETIEDDFFKAIGSTFTAERRTQIALRLNDFRSYHTDTATLGLTISPQAAHIQANDPATIANREATVAVFKNVKGDLAAKIATERTRIAALQKHVAFLLVAVPCLAIILGLALAGWVVRSQIRAPLQSLKTCMGALARGHLDVTVPYVHQTDEIGEMASSLTVFRDALQAKRDAAQSDRDRSLSDARRADRIVDVTRVFEARALDMMRDLSSSVAVMDVAANDVATTSDHTLIEAKTVWQAADDATTILTSVSGAATDLSRSASNIAARVEATHRVVRDALDDADASRASIESLIEAADEIGGASGLIDAIARQTNLLALNATIEAARAGDYGRGFAVVAGEVKFLAKQTAEATAQINGQVAMIQEASAVSAKVMRTVRDALNAINEIIGAVAASATEQGRSSESMANALVGATARARIVSESIGAVSGSALTNGARAAELMAKATDHTAQASRLSKVIVDFVGDVRRTA